nr:integrase, catalytic region, zinc finger, CCHC-type, peptidase aspartic, catalytic [Tanacetum cinerariifolium]
MQMVRGNGGSQFRPYAGQNAGNPAGYNDVIGNQVIQNAVQNPRVQNVGNPNGLMGVQGNGNQNQIGNGNLVAAHVEGNAAGKNGNQIRCYNCRGIDEEYDLMAAAADLDDIEEVNANCILMANLQQASTSGTQSDSTPVYDQDGSAEVHKNYDDNEIFNLFTQEEQYTELLEPIPELHQVPQNDNDVVSDITGMKQGREIVEQHPTNLEETRALYDLLYQNLATEVEKVNSVNRKSKETNAELTTELARYKNQERCFQNNQEKYNKLEKCYQQSVYQEQCLSKKINALHLSTAKFVGDFKSLAKKADDSLAKQKAMELDNERLLKAVVSQDVMNVVQKESVVDTSDLQTERERCSKHMTGNLKLLINFVWKFMGTVRFGNDHVAAILGFGDLQWGSILINRVYFIEGLGHNLFSVGQFCDSNLEVAFRRNACFVRNLEGVDLLKGDRSTNLYIINLHEMASASPICLMAC